MDRRHPALARLDVLIGRWTVQPKVDGLGHAWTEFTWQEDGVFLRQHTYADPFPPDAPREWRENAPFPVISLIGFDDVTEEFTMLYADGRGVHRVYRMTFDGTLWRMWRDAPGFNQRFTGTLSGDTVEARWEQSEDGVTWALDFELTYTRAA
jgi:hypothetical protein